MKDLIKKLLREGLNVDDGESKWMYEKSYENKKSVFVNDTYEILTGFFGVLNDKLKTKKVLNIISKIFDNTIKNVHHHGIIIHLKQVDALCGYFNTNDDDIIIGLIENIWNGE